MINVVLKIKCLGGPIKKEFECDEMVSANTTIGNGLVFITQIAGGEEISKFFRVNMIEEINIYSIPDK